jgi:hypothetical protein
MQIDFKKSLELAARPFQSAKTMEIRTPAFARRPRKCQSSAWTARWIRTHLCAWPDPTNKVLTHDVRARHDG